MNCGFDYFAGCENAAKPLANRKNRFSSNLCDVELVTLDKAVVDRLLAGNINNRKVNKSNLEAITSEFKNGRYKFTGEPIVRDEHGILRDGQHRLLALRNAGYPNIQMLLVTLHGERSKIEEAYDKMNTGRSRKFGQLLEHKGVLDPLKVASLCKKIPYIESGYGKYPCKTDSFYLDVMRLYRVEIEAIAPLLKNRGFRADMGAAACAIAKVTGCLDEIVSLCRRAIDNNMLQVGTPEHTLNKIINDSLRATKKGQGENAFLFAVTAHCIIAALNKEKYPVVNRNVKTAIKWIKDMAADNKLILVPASYYSA